MGTIRPAGDRSGQGLVSHREVSGVENHQGVDLGLMIGIDHLVNELLQVQRRAPAGLPEQNTSRCLLRGRNRHKRQEYVNGQKTRGWQRMKPFEKNRAHELVRWKP